LANLLTVTRGEPSCDDAQTGWVAPHPRVPGTSPVPGQLPVAWQMGLNVLELGDGKQAVSIFERCLKEFPNSQNRSRFEQELARARQLLSGL
jgi:hypothetical protein